MLLVYTSLPPLFCRVTSKSSRNGEAVVAGVFPPTAVSQCLLTSVKDGDLIDNEMSVAVVTFMAPARAAAERVH